MLIPMQDAADYLDTALDNLYISGKYKPFIVKQGDHYRFDMKSYSEHAAKLQGEEDFCIDMVNFAEFVIEIIGEDGFWKQIPTMKRQEVKRGFEKSRFAPSIAEMIEGLFAEAWRERYENYEEVDEKPEYVPFEEREPLTRWYLMGVYWQQKKTTEEIAKELNVPKGWVYSEIRRLDLQKKTNGIKLKGRKGYVMPDDERVKHRVQPHAKPVVQICPKSFIVIKEYSSTGAVERYGFNRENVRNAIDNSDHMTRVLMQNKVNRLIDHAAKQIRDNHSQELVTTTSRAADNLCRQLSGKAQVSDEVRAAKNKFMKGVA